MSSSRNVNSNTAIYKPRIITHANGSRGGNVFTPFFLRVCLFFRTISQKSMQLGSPDLTKKCSTISPIYFGVNRSKVRSRVTKTLPVWIFALLWVLASSTCVVQATQRDSVRSDTPRATFSVTGWWWGVSGHVQVQYKTSRSTSANFNQQDKTSATRPSQRQHLSIPDNTQLRCPLC